MVIIYIYIYIHRLSIVSCFLWTELLEYTYIHIYIYILLYIYTYEAKLFIYSLILSICLRAQEHYLLSATWTNKSCQLTLNNTPPTIFAPPTPPKKTVASLHSSQQQLVCRTSTTVFVQLRKLKFPKKPCATERKFSTRGDPCFWLLLLQFLGRNGNEKHLSNEKKPWWVRLYRGWKTTHLYKDYNKPL